ncbi:TrmH family RNA methyltransferase [Pedobacter chitinilyticus]|uniref:RNA methyltransferase n=1 Tax=Pedobacter chitinilyticus TaxID=2233776 RepID=A0A443Z0L5_9SPHI|nr:RNA methyltransferase [Pedobacter chitinilyticus]RWU10040.1 RNA methyltransferase [Pedobacter chitinilyticus]
MLSKSQISFIKSLHQKKYRKENGIFIIEGIKSIIEFLKSDYQIHSIYYTSKISATLPKVSANINLFEVTEAELQKISTLQTPQHILALVHIPSKKEVDSKALQNAFSLVLDDVQDPGNLGTIIRTADWFGIKTIICSENTVEAYNPKTVQSTMGSLCRVNIIYTSLAPFLKNIKLPIYGALLDGENIYQTNWGNEGLILLGNEGHGIGKELIEQITVPVTIPRFGAAESLNVAVSAAIFCSEISRK